MSAILGVFARRGPAPDRGRTTRMLAAMSRRGADRSELRHVGQAALGVARHGWEMDAQFGGRMLLAHDGDATVAADATLYYRRDLLRALSARGVCPAGSTPAHLILAAYRAWGDECAAHLEGDFAFALWDARARRALAARDFAGKRPLFHAVVGDTWVVASSISAIVEHPGCSPELDVAVLAEAAAALTGSAEETAWRAVRRVPPGASVSWGEGGGTAVTAHWHPPAFRDFGGTSFDDAAAELRGLLCDAVSERLAATGRTTVCLSGGWDSPAVFACGLRVLQHDAGDRSLDAISVSFPPGDPGHEDELIAAIVRSWNTDARWLRSDDIPALDRIAERAAERDEPFPHPFEMMNRALARASAAMGARVVLDGNGGDQLFQVSDVYLADLLRGGRWLPLAREWRELRRGGGGSARDFARDVVAPASPNWLLRGVDLLRDGRPLAGRGLERRPPRWMRADFVRRHALLEREREHVPRRRGESRAAHEIACQLRRPMLARMSSDVSSFALESGAEHRSPLCDGRVVRFAASRPVLERRSGLETKRLLRRAMAGLLPAEVLAPRKARTGVPVGYLVRAVREQAPPLVEELFRAPLLGELGIVEPAAVRAAWADALRRNDAHATVALYLALEAELWLRAHGGGVVAAPRDADPRPAPGGAENVAAT